MSVRIITGDVFEVLPTIEPGSIDVAITSPPYWRLRSYLPKGHPLKHLELGSEPTPGEYVANQVKVFSLVREAMADHAVCFINVGDTYTHAPGKRKTTDAYGEKQKTNGYEATTESASAPDIDAGNLCLIPQRLAIALQDDGWTVRSVIVWHKPSAMPASLAGWMWRRCRVKVSARAPRNTGKKGQTTNGQPQGAQSGGVFVSKSEWTDCHGCKRCSPHGGYVLRRGSWRPTSSWEPILMLAKGNPYFADGESVKLPPAQATIDRDKYTRILDDPDEQFAVQHDHETVCTGANPRDVQTWAAEPLREAHYAAYPTALATFCLKAATSQKGYCRACGSPWVRVVDVEQGECEAAERPKKTGGMDSLTSTLSLSGNGSKEWAERGAKVSTLGWRPSCSCNAGEPRPGRVLDTFCGSGRSGIAARRLGLDFIGIELNEVYASMARKLIEGDLPLFNTAIDDDA